MSLARLQEETIQALTKKNKVIPKPIPQLPQSQKTYENTSKNSELGQPVRKLTQKDFDDRRSKGLCFGCDEKYFRGHVCKKKQLFMLEAEEEEEIYEEAQQDILTESL